MLNIVFPERKGYVDSLRKYNELPVKSGVINLDLNIVNGVKELRNIILIKGRLNIVFDGFESFGELKEIKDSLYIESSSCLNSLNKIEKVGDYLVVRNNCLSDLGNLKYVGGNLDLSDSIIKDLGNLKYVGGNLKLPENLRGINLDKIQIKGKVRYFKNKNQEVNENYDWTYNGFFSDIHKNELLHKKRFLTGDYLVKRCFNFSDYNNYTITNIKEFIEFVDTQIELLYDTKFSFYDVLFNQIKTIQEINNEFPSLKVDKRKSVSIRIEELKNFSKEYFQKNKNVYPVLKYQKVKGMFKNDDWNGKKTKLYKRYDENPLGFSVNSCESEWNPYKNQYVFGEGFIYFIENSLLETFSIFIDSLQNKFRVSRGLPKIGEGWISETELYYQLKEYFTGYKVIHHGKPKWLGRQHVDIWFPEFNIGVEYQGEQHLKPIDFFGGEDSFKKNLERDKRKKDLFKENNSYLIEVFPQYRFQDIIQKIEDFIKEINK